MFICLVCSANARCVLLHAQAQLLLHGACRYGYMNRTGGVPCPQHGLQPAIISVVALPGVGLCVERVGTARGSKLCRTGHAYGHVAVLPGLNDTVPHGELWSIGDQPTVAALLENEAGQRRRKVKAPHIGQDMSYIPNPDGREIYVYDDVDRRMLMEDFFAKLHLCYGK